MDQIGSKVFTTASLVASCKITGELLDRMINASKSKIETTIYEALERVMENQLVIMSALYHMLDEQ